MAENFKIDPTNLTDIKRSDVKNYSAKDQKLLNYLFDFQRFFSDDKARQTDDTLDVEELMAFMSQMDKTNDKAENNDEISLEEVEAWIKANNAGSKFGTATDLLSTIKGLFGKKADAADTGAEQPQEIADVDLPGVKSDGDGDYIEVQKWGSEALDGNKSANDCLSRIAKNYYPDMDQNEAMQLIMDANPQIYGEGATKPNSSTPRGSRTGTIEERYIYDGERINLPNLPKPEIELVDEAKMKSILATLPQEGGGTGRGNSGGGTTNGISGAATGTNTDSIISTTRPKGREKRQYAVNVTELRNITGDPTVRGWEDFINRYGSNLSMRAVDDILDGNGWKWFDLFYTNNDTRNPRGRSGRHWIQRGPHEK